MSQDATKSTVEQWLSSRYKRWDASHSMPPSRQKELIEEFVAQLPQLPHGCRRESQVVCQSTSRDERVELAPSKCIPSLTAVYLTSNRIKARSRILDYTGWILTDEEYQQFGYAVHTAVHLSRLFDGGTKYVLLGDPTLPAAQINCVSGTTKRPNAQLIVKPCEMKSTHITESYITVRATRIIKAGEEIWIDYGREYWEHMSLYCPHCLEYGADSDDQMLICEVPDCKRAWHQLCCKPCLVDVPEEGFYCDLHTLMEIASY